MADKKFMFFENYWKSIMGLPQEERGKILEGIIKYGLYGEYLPDEPQYTTARAFVQSFHMGLDNSREYTEKKATAGAKGGSVKKIPDDVIRMSLLKIGPKATMSQLVVEVQERMDKMYKDGDIDNKIEVKASTLYKRDLWLQRDELIWKKEKEGFNF